MKTEYKVCKNIITSEIGEDMIVLFGDSKKMLIFNETSTLIFKMIDEGMAFNDIQNALALTYDLSKIEIQESIEKIIKEFVEKGVVESNEID